MARRLSRGDYGLLLSSADRGVVTESVPDDVWALLIGAYAHARAGRFVAARELVRRVTRGDPPGLASLIAGRLLYVCRDHAEALEAFDEAARREPRLSGRALSAKVQHAARIGWAPETRRTIEALRVEEPSQLRWHLEGLRLSSRAGDLEPALRHVEAALALEPNAASIQMERAWILAKLQQKAEAVAAADRAVTLDHGSMTHLLEAARIGMEVGDYAAARRHLTRGTEVSREDVRPAAELARLALFALDVDAAEAVIDALPLRAAAHPLVRRTRGAIDVLSGRHEAALRTLEGVTRDDPTDSEAYTWLAEARLRLGLFESVDEALHRAMTTSDGYLLPARILRSLSHVLFRDDGDAQLRARRFEALLWSVEALVEGGRQALESGDRSRITTALERSLSALGGNRTPYSSKVVDGQLTALPRVVSPRHASRRALSLIGSADPARVLSALDAVVARFPTSSAPMAHRGELRLWLGDVEGARRDLERAIEIDAETRSAWMGLTAIETLEGRPRRALEVSARGIDVTGGAVGSSAYAHRADARAALGQIDDAIADLEKSIELSPTRLGARVALASLLDRRGDDARARALFDQLVDEAPGLLSDAARDEGIVLWKTRRPSPTADDRKRVLGRALTLLGGNRSASRVTYRTSGGVLRTVPTPVGERPHLGGDEHDLAHIKRLLCRASGVSSRAGPSRLEPVLARTDSEVELVDLVDPVDPVDVETFVSRGCVRVRGAFSQEIAKRWVARAAARIREDPRRWVRGYDESDPERALDAFDPDDQGTWTWERLDLSATEELPLERVAPRAFDLAATLVGGAARFERALVSDHLSVNFHNQSDPKRIAPTLGDGSWHLDDPARDDRLTTFRRGLIVFIVLSDLRPRSGAPFIAPESVARVARELAAHPETGVDFVARDVSMRISAECTERVELEGELGDVFLIHPMMLHSSSGNPSGRIRWMANPILTLKEPLRLDGDDPSPLERSVLIALGTGQK